MDHEKEFHRDSIMKRDGEGRAESVDDQRPVRDSDSVATTSSGVNRFADPAESAADSQLSAPYRGRDRAFTASGDPHSQSLDAADITSKDIAEDPRVSAAIERLRRIDGLEPARWRVADSSDRQHAIREANRALAESFGRPSPEVIFVGTGDKLELSRRTEGQWSGYDRSGQPYFIEIAARFLDKTREPEPREAVNTICHEYRHVYQREVLRDELNPAEPGSPEASWAKNFDDGYVDYRENFDAYESQPVERNSRKFADDICRRLYN